MRNLRKIMSINQLSPRLMRICLTEKKRNRGIVRKKGGKRSKRFRFQKNAEKLTKGKIKPFKIRKKKKKKHL